MPDSLHERTPVKGVSRFLHHLPALLGVLLLVGAFYVVQKEFRHLKLREIADALRAIPPAALIFSSSGPFCRTSF